MKISNELTKKFPVNTLVAEKQEEYFTVPANSEFGVVAFAFELDEEEIKDIIEHKKIYVLLLNGEGYMQPINIQLTPSDFDDAVEWNHDFMKERGFKSNDDKDKEKQD